jgi:enoyl-CoA hydratase/carnithine racemase
MIDGVTTAELIRRGARRFRDRTAVLCGDDSLTREALQIGLPDRVVPDGAARAAAEELALELAEHPQPTMRADRLSAYEGLGPPLEDALEREFARGVEQLDEAPRGAARFEGGEGRHGA